MPTPSTPVPTPGAFWSTVAASGLVDAGVLASLRKECETLLAAKGATSDEAATTAVAGWLVKRNVLSQWQARRLLRGDGGPFFIGDYRLLDRLPCDGSGRLYRGRHEPSGRAVLLVQLNKSLCQQLDVWTEIVRRTTIANQTANPLLSRTWALEQSGAERLIVCEDVAGVPLADEIDRLGQLSITQAAPLILAVARAVADLHRQGAVHGAISLDTLRREPPPAGGDPRSGRVRLLQFPLAGDPHQVRQRIATESPEAIARIGRRASFVAPELLLPETACDTRSDVYALGCVFHALLTGAAPCWQGDAQRTLAQAAFVGPTPLGPPEVPAPVATLVSYLTARVPSARYQTAVEAADAIAACFGLSGGPAPAVAAAAAAAAAVPAAAAVSPGRVAGVAAGGPTAPAAAPYAGATTGPVGPVGAVALPGALAPADARPVGAVSARDAAIQAATLAARRRAARLRTIGLGILGGILLATAAAVIVQSLPQEHREQKPVTKAGSATGRLAADDKATDEPAAAEATDGAPAAMADVATAADDPAVGPPDEKPMARLEKAAGGKQAAVRAVVVDDPDLPWASPTDGSPPTLAYLPPGSQLVLLTRPAEISGDEEGRLFLRALGPRVEQAVQLLTTACGRELDGIESLQAGWQAGGPDEVVGGYAARLVDPLSVPVDPDAARTAWGDSVAEEIEGETIHKVIHDGKPFAYWLPAAENGHVLVAAPEAMVRQMIAAGRDAGDDDAIRASLPKDLDLLVGMLDGRRHLTIFGSPAYLLHDGRVVLAGPLAKLVEPLGEFFGEGTQAAAVSVHFGENFYAEIDAIATVETPAAKLAGTLAGRITAVADTVEEYCTALDPHPYGRKLVLRLPAMLRVLAANSRAGAEGKGVVVNGYLPRHAGHNLVLAAELALDQSPGQSPQQAAAGGPARADDGSAAQGALGRLQKRISLVFARDTLEKSIQMISEEIGVPMDIMGGDLQLEGITKNQSFGLDERDKTADAILRTILAKSNPDGKLVYVVHVKDGVETIDITTRAAAAKRGEKLPAGFEDGQKPADKKP